VKVNPAGEEQQQKSIGLGGASNPGDHADVGHYTLIGPTNVAADLEQRKPRPAKEHGGDGGSDLVVSVEFLNHFISKINFKNLIFTFINSHWPAAANARTSSA
jgi:hypothetical protein